jgi:glycosyltransferase involved in cell wall biosynthesis
MPEVSVIIPCYNHGQYIDEAIESVQRQSFTDYEIIIVNDGSDDPGTITKLQRLEENGLKVITTENQGLSEARNCGITASKGTFILPLDSDDRIGSGYLEEAVEVLKSRPEVKAVFAEAEYFGNKQGPMELYYNRRDLREFTVDQILLSNFVYCSILYRRADYDDARGYNPNMKYGWEDWDFLLSLLTKGGIIYKLSGIHFYYRIRASSMARSIDPEKKKYLSLQLYANHIELYGKLFDDPISLYHEKIELERQIALLKNSRSYLTIKKISSIFDFLK